MRKAPRQHRMVDPDAIKFHRAMRGSGNPFLREVEIPALLPGRRREAMKETPEEWMGTFPSRLLECGHPLPNGVAPDVPFGTLIECPLCKAILRPQAR